MAEISITSGKEVTSIGELCRCLAENSGVLADFFAVLADYFAVLAENPPKPVNKSNMTFTPCL